MTTKQQLIEKWEKDKEKSGYAREFLVDLQSLEEVNEGQIDEIKGDLDELYFSDKIDVPYKRINLVLDIIKKHLTSKPKEEGTIRKNQTVEPKEEVLTYEQGYERGRQIGYKEGWKARSKEEVEINEVLAYESGYKAGYEDCKNGKKSLIID